MNKEVGKLFRNCTMRELLYAYFTIQKNTKGKPQDISTNNNTCIRMS